MEKFGFGGKFYALMSDKNKNRAVLNLSVANAAKCRKTWECLIGHQSRLFDWDLK